MIDFVLEKSGEKSLTYIGHSQGTTEMFSELAKNEEKYAGKINLFVALSPLTQMAHVSDLGLKALADAEGILEPIIK